MIQVTGLFVYPVKSLRGIALNQSNFTEKGLAFDRHWMVVMPNGRMVTQRIKPLMARLETELATDSLIITAPGREPITVPLEEREGLEVVDVTVWRDQFQALDEGAKISSWLTEVLDSKYPLRLVRMANSINRPQSRPELLGEQTSTKFADLAPVLLANESSLSDLNRCLQEKGLEPVPGERFRVNIVVSGLEPYQEYSKGFLHEESDNYTIGLKFPSERCVIVNTDHQTGEVDKAAQQPLATLKEMNTAPNLSGAYFGQNSVIEKGLGDTIKIGDQLKLEID